MRIKLNLKYKVKNSENEVETLCSQTLHMIYTFSSSGPNHLSKKKGGIVSDVEKVG